MRTAYILHGTCEGEERAYLESDEFSPSNALWLPFIQQKILRSGLLCQTLEMPKPYMPVYEEWADVLSKINFLDNDIILGHSAGCGFALKYLGLHPYIKLDKLILVAPWLDPFRINSAFLDCTLDPALQDRIKQIHVLFSTNETEPGVPETKDMILKTYPKTILHRFEDKEHFCFDGSEKSHIEDLWNCVAEII